MKEGHVQYGVVVLGDCLNEEGWVEVVKNSQRGMDPKIEACFEVDRSTRCIYMYRKLGK